MRTPLCPSFPPPNPLSHAWLELPCLSPSPQRQGQEALESGARSGPEGGGVLGARVCTSFLSEARPASPPPPVLSPSLPAPPSHLPSPPAPERGWGQHSLTWMCRSSSRRRTAESSTPGSCDVGESQSAGPTPQWAAAVLGIPVIHAGDQWEVGSGREGAEQSTGKGRKGEERSNQPPGVTPQAAQSPPKLPPSPHCLREKENEAEMFLFTRFLNQQIFTERLLRAIGCFRCLKFNSKRDTQAAPCSRGPCNLVAGFSCLHTCGRSCRDGERTQESCRKECLHSPY